MYTSYIGKKFLSLYNQREGKELKAKEFFDQVLFPLFFNHDEHLMHVHGSSFFQKLSKAFMDSGKDEHILKLERLHSNIEHGKISGSTYVGYAAEDIRETTSGQLTSLGRNIESEEMYSSWIGQALAIGVSGGFVMLINRVEILWALFTGWERYREYLEQTRNLKDKQIETWNGHWLRHSFSNDYDPKDPFYEFPIQPENVLGKLAIPTIDWSRTIFALARKYPESIITAYAYNLSQTNTTLGFINLFLPEIKHLGEMQNRLFPDVKKGILTTNELERLKPFFNFRSACALGTIGLKALEPDKLRTYMPKGSVSYAQGKEYKFSDEASFHYYQIFKIWIIAMLNKTELAELAAKVASALLEKEKLKTASNTRGKTGASTFSRQLLELRSLPDLIRKLTTLMEDVQKSKDVIREAYTEILKMPQDQFPLFIALIGFEYSYQKSNNKN